MTQAEVQERVQRKFPILRRVLSADVRIEHPVVRLRSGSDDIGMELDISVEMPVLGMRSGTVGASGKLNYNQAERAFYIDAAALERLDVPGLRPELHAKVSAAVGQVLQRTLATVPVYTLKGRTAAETAAALALEKVVVRDGMLVATIGLP